MIRRGGQRLRSGCNALVLVLLFVGVVPALLLAAWGLEALGVGDVECILPAALAVYVLLASVVYQRLQRNVQRLEAMWRRTVALLAVARMRLPNVESYSPYLTSQEPLVGWFLRRRAARALVQDRSPAAVAILAEHVARQRAVSTERTPLRDIALAGLGDLSVSRDRAAVDVVCSVWAHTRDSDLAELIQERRWLAVAPPDVRVLTALLIGESDRLLEDGAPVMSALARACLDRSPMLAERARRLIVSVQAPDSLEALCQVVIQRDNRWAADALVSAGYLPQDEGQRALYFFVTEEWERYDVLDFERRLLRTAYASADDELRARIRGKVQASGRTDFLSIIAGEDLRQRAAQMSADEFDILLQTLVADGQWEQLWMLVFEAPFLASVHIVGILSRAGWRPEHADERTVYEGLVPLAADGLPRTPDEVRRLFASNLLPDVGEGEEGQIPALPPAVLRATARVPGRINDVAFAPRRPVIAVGTGRRKLVIWNYRRAERERVFDGFDHSIGRVVFTGDGTVVCAERTNRLNVPCAIHGWDGAGRQFRLGQHESSVTALAPIGETQLLSAGRDHHLRLWDVAARRLVAERSLGDYTWVRSLASSPDATRVLLHQGRVEMCALPTLEDLHMYMSRGKVRRIIFGLDAQHAIVGHSDGSVQPYAIEWRNVRPYWPRNAPRENRPNLVHNDGALTRHADRIVDLALLAEPAVVVSAASDGAVHFSSIEEHGLVGAVQAPSGQITSLHISPDQQVMALGSANASLSLWDIRALGIKGLLLRPFAETTVALMPIFDLLRDDEALEPAARRALDYAERVMRHRFRHDVEVGEAPLIMMGEFDIEID